MKVRFRKVVILCCFYLGFTAAKAQHIWYEPGTWQELSMLIYKGDYNSERLNLRNLGLWHTKHFCANCLISSNYWFGRLEDSTAKADSLVTWIDFQKKYKNKYSDRIYMVLDNPEVKEWKTDKSQRPVSGHFAFWQQPASFYLWTDGLKENRSTFIINPVINLGMGTGYSASVIQNGRGAEVRGNIMRKLAFYSRVVENQSRFASFTNEYRDSLGVVPGIGWWKNFKNGGTDYLQAIGYINAALIGNATQRNYLVMSAGHNSFMIGQGYRSLILSNFASPFGFLKFNTRIGPFRYQNIFGQLNGFSPLLGNTLLPKKNLALHRGSLEFGNRGQLELGFSEMTIHNRSSGGFDVDYLNPIIFYRAIEANLGSADNSLMALDATYKTGRFRFYGQFVLDEFKLKYIKQGGWWANKFGYQLGVMRTFHGRSGAGMAQLEYNTVRPYTYSHYNELNSYTHYNQPLAHPLGANFREWVIRGYFNPAALSRLRVTFTAMRAVQGQDKYWNSGGNFGANPRRDNDARVADFGVNMLQGEKAIISSAKLEMAYMIRHNLNFDLNVLYRNQTGIRAASGTWISAGLRLNFDQGTHLY